jgi:hypothetical protein
MSDQEIQTPTEQPNESNAPKKAPGKGGVTLKVSEKGALSVYGLGRFPVTLYREQWDRLLQHTDEIRQFIQENDSRLKKKE